MQNKDFKVFHATAVIDWMASKLIISVGIYGYISDFSVFAA